MNFFDDETNIISMFQNVDCSSVYFPIQNNEVTNLFELIHDEVKWKKWINSSGKNDPPPDFFCDEFKYMMDVMRVDDHSRKNNKGKLFNPTLKNESKIIKELELSGIYDTFPNANLIVNSNTNLPTYEDHNYKLYKKNFTRIIEKHKQSIKLYKKNHIGYKVIFFILDESSAYFQANEKCNITEKIPNNSIISGKPHLFFQDKSFLKVVLNTEIDYLIWYAPFKLIRTKYKPVELPEVCIFDLSLSNTQLIEYADDFMMSAEI